MKTTLLTTIAALTLLTACKKDEPEVAICPGAITPEVNYLISEPGSYWIYQWYQIDSLGNETTYNAIDTVTVIGDSVYNGNTYTAYESSYLGMQPSIKLLRDSSGYIVNQYGHISFSYTDLTNNITSGNNGMYDYYSMMSINNAGITLPVGTFNSSIVHEVHYTDPGGNPVNACGDMEEIHEHHFVEGIGEVMSQTAFFTQLQQCSYLERRLIEYQIP